MLLRLRWYGDCLKLTGLSAATDRKLLLAAMLSQQCATTGDINQNLSSYVLKDTECSWDIYWNLWSYILGDIGVLLKLVSETLSDIARVPRSIYQELPLYILGDTGVLLRCIGKFSHKFLKLKLRYLTRSQSVKELRIMSSALPTATIQKNRLPRHERFRPNRMKLYIFRHYCRRARITSGYLKNKSRHLLSYLSWSIQL